MRRRFFGVLFLLFLGMAPAGVKRDTVCRFKDETAPIEIVIGRKGQK